MLFGLSLSVVKYYGFFITRCCNKILLRMIIRSGFWKSGGRMPLDVGLSHVNNDKFGHIRYLTTLFLIRFGNLMWYLDKKKFRTKGAGCCQDPNLFWIRHCFIITSIQVRHWCDQSACHQESLVRLPESFGDFKAIYIYVPWSEWAIGLWIGTINVCKWSAQQMFLDKLRSTLSEKQIIGYGLRVNRKSYKFSNWDYPNFLLFALEKLRFVFTFLMERRES